MTGRNVDVRAVPTAGSNSRATQLEFHRTQPLVTGSGWDGYTMKPVNVSLDVADRCFAVIEIVPSK